MTALLTGPAMDTDSIEKLTCGLVMPISGGDECSAEHWQEVRGIIQDSVTSVTEFDFKVSLVSESDETSVIQKRIINGLYESDIIICDVSTLNANVMFELGMRLAFDKATIIIKDDSTQFVFDTSGFEHVIYPRDLRFGRITDFKNTLSRKIVETYKASMEDNYSAFLGQYGEYRVRGLDEYAKNITGVDELFFSNRDTLEEIRELAKLTRKDMLNIDKRISFLEATDSMKNINRIKYSSRSSSELGLTEKDRMKMEGVIRGRLRESDHK